MFKVGTLSDEELKKITTDMKGGKEKKAELIVALKSLDVGQYINVDDTVYSYVSVRARVSELMAQMMDVKFKTQRFVGFTRVIRVG
jgi:hypothetical protein